MIQNAFAQMFPHLDLHLPGENMRDRRNGSLPYGSGRLFYTFGEEDGREYLEYDTHHRMGDDHGKIYEDGEFVGLPSSARCSAMTRRYPVTRSGSGP